MAVTKWMTSWDELNPVHVARVLCGLDTLEKAGISVCIPSSGGKRTDEQQKALYAQGRDDKGNIVNSSAVVTNCDGVKSKSKHQLGLATDIVPQDKNGNPCWPALTDPRWKGIRDAMVAQGLVAGMDWKDFPDYPHYESKGV